MEARNDMYADLARRGLALFLDFVAIETILIAINTLEIPFGKVGVTVLSLAYFVVLPASPMQGTPGKRLAGLKITDLSGNRIGPGRAALRFAAGIVSIGAAGIGMIVAAFTPRRQALHDLVAKTLVVRRRATAEEIAASRATAVGWPSRIGLVALVGITVFAIFAMVQFEQARKRVRQAPVPASPDPLPSPLARP